MPAHPHLRVPSLVLAILGLAGCAGSGAPPAGPTPAQTTEQPTIGTAPGLSDAQALEVRNAREPVANLITAAQPSQEQFDALVDAGFEHFISLRLPTENGAGWEEDHAPGAPVSFDRLPITGTDGLTRKNVEKLDRLLQEMDGEATVLYCGSSNRVGSMMALRAFWLKGASAEEALEVGRASGLTRMEPAVAEIIAKGR